MKACYQFENIDMLQHGKMVHREYRKLIDRLNSEEEDVFLCEMYKILKPLLLDEKTIRRYQIFHDCGKPFSNQENGKKFADHAKHSANQWRELFPSDVVIFDLMLYDMAFHEGASDEIYRMQIAPTLYLTAWAELYANCRMFGGEESTSFKIKKKKLTQQGKKLKKVLTE